MSEQTPSAPLTIDIVSDAVCPWCWIGKRNLDAALAANPDLNVDIRWRPYQLDPTIPAGGLDRKEYMQRKFGDRVPGISERITEAGREAGIDFVFDAIKISPNTIDAHRLIRWAASAGVQTQVVEDLFRVFFHDGGDIGDHATLLAVGMRAGMDEATLTKLLASDADVDAVEQEIATAQGLGISGVPCFIFGGQFAVSGAQPPSALSAALKKAAALPPDESAFGG